MTKKKSRVGEKKVYEILLANPYKLLTYDMLIQDYEDNFKVGYFQRRTLSVHISNIRRNQGINIKGVRLEGYIYEPLPKKEILIEMTNGFKFKSCGMTKNEVLLLLRQVKEKVVNTEDANWVI